MSQRTDGSDRFHKAFLLLLVVAISALFLATIREFLVALLLAAVVTGLCQPLYRRLSRALGGRAALAAGTTVLVVLLAIGVPLLLLATVVAAQAVEVSQNVAPWVAERLRSGPELLGGIELPEALRPYQQQILSKAAELAGRMGNFLVEALAAATRGTVSFLFLLFVMLYSMFFFLKDGPAILERILYYMPLARDEEQRMVERFVSVTRATLKGTLVIGVVQGTLAGLAFAVVGLPGAAFWGTIMALLSIIPGLGTALVWVPAVLWLAVGGQLFAAGGLALWCAAVVGTADNLLRPMLVGKDTRMSDLLILLSTLGGLLLYGAVGILIGPLVAALFVTVWDIYGVAFGDYLTEPPELAGGEETG